MYRDLKTPYLKMTICQIQIVECNKVLLAASGGADTFTNAADLVVLDCRHAGP